MSRFSSSEEKQLLSWGTGEVQPVEAVCYHELFEGQALATPGATALVHGAESLTYRRLDERANQLARTLQGMGVGPEVTVALALERSPALILSMLAVLKAGGAYVPLDPGHPRERLAYLLEDSGTDRILTHWTLADRLPTGPRRLFIDDLEEVMDAQSTERPENDAGPDNLAYLIYTSGSTGRPKGVMVPHRGLANLSATQGKLFGAGPGKRVLQFAPPSFDASVFEILMALASGATLVLTERNNLVPGPELVQLLEEQAVTHVTMPPSVLAALPVAGGPKGKLPALENVVCAGEALPAALVDAWAPGRRMWNAYGPTEATVWSSVEACKPGGGKPSIGRPLPNVELRVVEDGAGAAMSLCPAGTGGELLIGGVGLARGYQGKPALTAEAFVPDPFSGEPGARLYKSGDRVQHRDDGRMEFLGRIDHQVKIRGHRIEPGEVAAELDLHPAVRSAFVMARQDSPGPPKLVAYVVLEGPNAEAADAGPPDLKPYLEERLPSYMVPASIVVLEEIPLTPNGKVDREALPAPLPDSADLEGALEHVAPRGPVEKALAEISADLLGLDEIGVHDDFFALGGHSLLVGQLVARAREVLGVEITLKEVYDAPTVAGLAAAAARTEGRLELPPIRRYRHEGPAPLSFPQERVWFLNELAPGNVAYNSQATITFEGPLVPELYHRALTEIVRRHEVYRSRFLAVDGRPVQIVEDAMEVPFPLVDLQGLEEPERSEVSEALVRRAFQDPFDLEKPPLARWSLLRLAPELHVLVQVEHHFVHDGWAFSILLKEMKDLYQAYAAGQPSPLPEPPVQASDFALWQREWLQGEVLEEYLDFYTSRLEGCASFLDLPTDHPRPKVQTFVGSAVRVELPKDESDKLRRLARSQGVTLFTAMLAGFKSLLFRYSGQRDLLAGTAAANRRLREVELMISMVVNTLVLRSQVTPDQPFSDLMTTLQDTALGAFAYQDMPLDKLIERLDPERDLSRNPLFQVMFSFHDSPVPDMDFCGLTGTMLERHNGSAKADLNIVGIPRAEQRIGREAKEGAEGITLIWEYSTDLFEPVTMERMVGHYRRLLDGAADHPHLPLAELPLLTPAEAEQLKAWNETDPVERSVGGLAAAGLHQLFEAAAETHPERPAVAAGEAVWTYRDLDVRANQLARYLRRRGVGPESVVALCIDRSPHLVLGALGVLKAGGAYLPMDPGHPAHRLAYTLEDSGARLLLAAGELSEELEEALAGTDAEVVRLDGDASNPEAPFLDEEEDRLGIPVDPLNRAYVIYTSGSTGKPKGTELTHAAAASLVAWHLEAMEVTARDRATLVASPAFDASVWETWPYLAAGACLCIPEPEVRADPEALYRWLAQEKVTITFLPTPLAETLLKEEVPEGLALRTLLVGGDRLHRPPAADLPFTLVNNYGPTEDAVVSTSGVVAPSQEGEKPPAPSIGRPITGTRAHVLDPRLRPVPVGVPGELSVAGRGLARCYLKRPGLTADRFLPDPFSAEPGARLYRTGDRVRLLADGQIDFLGRTDFQVKVRGFRIELGEIEAVLEADAAVDRAVVVPTAEGGRLMAFLLPKEGQEVDADALRAGLAERMPEYMVPGAFEVLGELPLSPTGKVDRKALAAREDELDWGSGAAGPRRSQPRSLTEELMAGIWKGVLGRAEIGVHEDFFALGGHSLLATQVASRVRDAFQVELPLRILFEHSTVADLSREVDSLTRSGAASIPGPKAGAAGDEALMSFAQERMWFLDRLITDRAAYHIARGYGLSGLLKVGALERAAEAVVRRHPSLRTRFAEQRGEPLQIVEAAVPPQLPMIDLSALGDEKESLAAELRRGFGRRPFDLRRLPLVRLGLLRLGAEEHQLVLTQHHIVTDGWSTGIFLRELAAFYAAELGGSEPGGAAPELPIQELGYGDYAVWQRGWMAGDALKRLVDFWRQALAGAPGVLELPLDRPRPTLQSFRGAQITFHLPREVSEGLDRLSGEAGVTWFMTQLAAFATLLSRLSGQTDLVVGTPVAGRDRQELEDLVGLFVNTLALRLQPKRTLPFRRLLGQTREVTVAALAHQDLPFEKLVEELAPERDLSHAPVYQTLFVPGDPSMDRLELAGLAVDSLPVRRDESQFDLALFVEPAEDGLELALRYDTALFDETTVQRTARQLGILLAEIARDASRPLGELPLLTAAERHAAVVEWNDRGTAVPRVADGLMHQLFEEQARKAPEAVAIVTPWGQLTYRELEEKANRLAHLLRRLGATRGSLVGVHLDRREEMVVAVLAVLKAGAAYVPLESTWPAERIRWIVEERGITFLLTQGHRLRTLEDEDPLDGLSHVVFLDEELPAAPAGSRILGTAAVFQERAEAPPATGSPEDLAYIIFTSGSTGVPKGVMVRHRPVVNLFHWIGRTFGVGPGDRLLYTTALSFDLSVYDVFGTLAAGATIRLASDAELEDPEALVGLVAQGDVTFWDSAPAALQRLAPFFPERAPASRLRLVFLSGDWIPVGLPDRVRKSFSGARVISLGGATEATVWSNVFPIGEVDPQWASIPYGRPIDNGRYHILDERLEPCPIGVTGDLYIAGGVLSDGYAGAPRQTALQYLPDPFSRISPLEEAPGGRIYATGDRARFWADGVMEFLGRRDTQVKVRGYRIELGEIETVLREHPRVAEAVVLVREDTPGDQRLVAYLTAEAGEPQASFAELRQAARARLPEYMVPTGYVALDSWPLTATGKLDRKALPSPEEARKQGTPKGKVSPRTRAEEIIAEVWKQVIGLDSVGTDENFFELGGHSLLIARVHGRLQEELDVEVSMADLFRFPTVASLAEALVPKEMGLPEPAEDSPAAAAAKAPAEAGQGEKDPRAEMVAIVGLAGRFAAAKDVDDFWQSLSEGRDLVRRFTEEELLEAGVDPEEIADPRYVPARGMLPEHDHFDAAFFDYTPREAEIMDPQQRLFLECSWQALENAGYGRRSPETRIGVYAGVSANGYVEGLMADRRLVQSVGGYQIAISNHGDYLPTRVSYKLDLKGPSLNVQTACSTSLVAVHLACRAILNGECEMALAGGVSVRGVEERGYFFEEGGVASPDGRTRTFDAKGSGTVGGSGVGAVVLKRLDEAMEDGDTVYAVVRGSAINNDGATKVGFTAPSVDGQAAAIREAQKAAGVEPSTIGYVEAHGTATPLGDPIEVAALNEVFGNGNDREAPCLLGSVKSNMGHLDAAAGVAGLIKTALSLHHGATVPSLHFEKPNPDIAFRPGLFEVATETRPWPKGQTPRRAGVSSFGIGGTNAHAILEEAPEPEQEVGYRTGRPVQLLVLSAKTEAALAQATDRLATHLETQTGLTIQSHVAEGSRREHSSTERSRASTARSGAPPALSQGETNRARQAANPVGAPRNPADTAGNPAGAAGHSEGPAENPGGATGVLAGAARNPVEKAGTSVEQMANPATDPLALQFEGLELPDPGLADIAYTLQLGRKPFEHRRFVVCSSQEEAVQALRGEAPAATEARHERPQRPSVAFLFPGQGSQYANMARHVFQQEAVFRESVEECAQLFRDELGGDDLRQLLFPDPENPEAIAAADAQLQRTSRTQPALFTIQLSLARLWMSWGVQPEALLGHSIGELAAATLSGVFRLKDAVHLVALRGKLMEEQPEGSMAAVALAEEDVLAEIARENESGDSDGSLCLAAVNGPEACVVSGTEAAVAAFAERLAGAGIEAQPLHTSHAFHSPMMEGALEPFRKAVAGVPRQAPQIPFLSNLSGTWITDEEATDPDYWARQLRRTVRFGDGLGELLSTPGRVLLEVGPGRQLSTLARRHPRRENAALIQTSLPHPKDRDQDLEALVSAAGQLWLAGIEPDWNAFHAGHRRRRVPLPTYPFERRRYTAGLRQGPGAELSAAPRGEGQRAGEETALEIPLTAAESQDGRSDEQRIEDATQRSVAEIWKDMLGVERVRAHDDFFDLGGSSLMAIRLGARLGVRFGVELPASFLLESSTVEELAKRIDRLASGDKAQEEETSCLVRLQGGRGRPVFAVHQVGGQAYTFRALSRALGKDQPFYALRSLGLEEGEEPLTTIEAMAEHYVSLVREAQPEGPYLLAGASMGGMVALEMARQLQNEGDEVPVLAVMDTPCLDQMPEQEDGAAALAAVVAGHTGVRLDLETLRQWDCLEEKLDYALKQVRAADTGAPVPGLAEIRRLTRVLETNSAALYAHDPEPYDGRIVLFRAHERRPGDPPRPELAWIQLALGGLDFVLCPGNHLSMHEPPHVETMAASLRRQLAEVSAVPRRVAAVR